MKRSLLAAALLLAVCSEGKKPSWRKWHARRLREVQTGNRDLFRSLGLHLDGRALLDRIDASPDVLRSGLEIVEKHRESIDKIYDLQASGVNISSIARTLRKSESQALETYNRLLEDELIPEPKTLQHDELAAALWDATGIKPSEPDAELFHIMAKHWNHKPPESALGVSAKFHADGRVEKARYHVALHLPCGDSSDAEQLVMSATEAAKSLKAPDLVHSWVKMVGEKLPDGSIQSMGFGIALLSDGSRAAKVYVTNSGGRPMPHLPIGGGKVLRDVLPTVGESLDANMVSLEWRVGDESVALRHYAAQRHESDEQRVMDFIGRGPLSDSIMDLMKMATSATETVRYTMPFTEKEVSTSGQAPTLSKAKLGLQLGDDHMADERFLILTSPVLKLLGVEGKHVQSWISSSSRVGHTVSNIQAGSSYVTLYRHPLHMCSLEQRLKERRLERRLQSQTPCQTAQDTFRTHMWGGDCATSMMVSNACTSCMNSQSGTYNGLCYQQCKDDWTKPCSDICTGAIADLIEACKDCHQSPQWCGKLGTRGIPTTFPLAACTSCDSSASYCSDPDRVCIDWMQTNTQAVFTKEFDDGDLIGAVQGAMSQVPQQCKYPMYPYLAGKYPLCNKCPSVYQGMHNGFLWGGPCEYTKACDETNSPEGQRLGSSQACAQSKNWQCGCGCGEVIGAVDNLCSQGQDLCSPGVPAACKTDDNDVHNKCDAGTYSSMSTMLWSSQFETSRCKVNNILASQCKTDVNYSSSQMMTFIVEGLQMENASSLPSNVVKNANLLTGSSIALQAAGSSRSSGSGGTLAGTTSAAWAMRFQFAALVVAFFGFNQE